MRFKARMAPEQVQLLYNIITPISRLHGGSVSMNTTMSALSSGRSVMHLDPDHIRISTRGGGGISHSSNTSFQSSSNDAEGISCFVELVTENGIFLEHRIESVANNIIVFEIDLMQLRTALQSIIASEKAGSKAGNSQPLFNSGTVLDENDEDGRSISRTNPNPVQGSLSSFSPSVVLMKLAKRNGGIPCLCLDAMGGGRGAIEVHHAIPIRIMRAIDMQYHLPPRINMPDVQLELPCDRPLRTVVERLRLSSPHIYIEGSMAGELVLRVQSEALSIRTYFNKMIPRFEDCKAHEGTNPAKCTLKVDSKKFLACLNWQNNLVIGRAVSSAVLCMVENEMLVLHVTLFPESVGFFTFYVPVHFLTDCD